MQTSETTKPYVLSYTDHYFYIRAQSPKLSSSETLRINRLTNKMDILDDEAYFKEPNINPDSKVKNSSLNKSGRQETEFSSLKRSERICLVVGTLIVSQQPYLIVVNESEVAGAINKEAIYKVKNIRCLPFKHKMLYHCVDQEENQRILNFIKDQIVTNNFYFCFRQQLTLTRQRVYEAQQKGKPKRDDRFFWNQQMLQRFPSTPLWQIPIVQGYVREIYSENTYFSYYYLTISRRSKQMCGTRFNSRGIDSEGHASNFVETEQIFVCHQWLFSHVGIRGSAPIYWTQIGVGQQIKFPKENQNQAVLQKHYEDLNIRYNCQITTVNLLSKNKMPEKDLKSRFQFYFYKVFGNKGKYLFFDLNEETRDKQNGQIYIDRFVEENLISLVGQQNFFCFDRYKNSVLSKQYSVSRVNCLDCIDRTNVVLARIGEGYLKGVEQFVNQNVELAEKKLNLKRDFFLKVIDGWGRLGDAISMMYCGTESVATHLTKKENHSWMSMISGSIKSINRYYNANVNDAFKHTCIDSFLGKIGFAEQDPLTLSPYFEDNICDEVAKEEVNYCSYSEIGVYILTWNCSMVQPTKLSNDPKKNRLFWFHEDDVDIVIVCLQQMVQLNSYNVLMGNNQIILTQWQKLIEKAINQKRTSKTYRYLASHDLVGISTFIFVEEKVHKKIIQPVVCQQIKTGFKGSLGNKGAILFFLKIDSTRITIINCHLAAGEGKALERSQDVQHVHHEAIKQRKQRRFLDRSQFKFLIGDMNFRLDAKNEDVRKVLYNIEKQQQSSNSKLTRSEVSILLQTLLQKDELKQCQTQHGALSTYLQSEITFLPTYKYVKKANQYDSKRTPSWCDRILYYSRQKLKLSPLKYQDIDCYQSDHKPVMGMFKILVKKEDQKKKRALIEKYLGLGKSEQKLID